MSEHKYRLAHEYLISRIRLRTGDIETPAQKYDRVLSTRAKAWEKEGHDRRHLLRLKEIYQISKLWQNLNWQNDRQLKVNFLYKSIKYRFASFFILLLLIMFWSSVSVYYVNKIKKSKELEGILNKLQYKDEYTVNQVETELIKLSSKSITVKKKILSIVLNDTTGCYKESLIPYLLYSLFGASNQNKWDNKNLPIFIIDQLQTTNNPKVRERMAYALGTIGKEAASVVVPTLIDVLQKTNNPDVQRRVASALGAIGKEAASAVPTLIEVLQKTKKSEVQQRIASSLGAIGKEAASAVPTLIEVLQKTNDFDVQCNVVDALGAIGKKATSAVPTLIEVLQKTNDFDVQWRVVDALGAIGKEAASAVVPALIEVLQKTNDFDMQESLASALGVIGREAAFAVPTLIEVMQKTSSADVQQRVTSALGAIGKEAASTVVPELIDVLKKSNNADVHRHVASALGAIGKKAASAVLTLIEVLQKTNDADVQWRVTSALGEIGREAASAVVPALTEVLQKTKDSFVRQCVADALGEIGESGMPDLRLLSDVFQNTQNYQLKYSIAKAMLKIESDKDHLKNLIEVILPHPIIGYKNKEEIIELVGKVAGKEAAGESLDFGGDIWKMLEWWEEYKKK